MADRHIANNFFSKSSYRFNKIWETSVTVVANSFCNLIVVISCDKIMIIKINYSYPHHGPPQMFRRCDKLFDQLVFPIRNIV